MYSYVAPIGELAPYRYVVILSRYQGKLLLSRHQERDTWETQGGHVEAGETVTQAARRELWEESGALRYTLSEAFDYKAGDEHGSATGRVFFAEIETLGPIPESEMAETALFDDLPVAITYPGILPELWAQPSTQEFFWKKSELKSAFLLPVLAGGFFIFRRFLPGNSANVLENHLFHQNQQKGRRMCRGISDVLMHGQTIESGKGLCYDKGG